MQVTTGKRRPALSSHPNVAGQAAERQAEALDQPDHGPDDDQNDAENQNPFADHVTNPEQEMEVSCLQPSSRDIIGLVANIESERY